jgi:hypothetical protein
VHSACELEWVSTLIAGVQLFRSENRGLFVPVIEEFPRALLSPFTSYSSLSIITSSMYLPLIFAWRFATPIISKPMRL